MACRYSVICCWTSSLVAPDTVVKDSSASSAIASIPSSCSVISLIALCISFSLEEPSLILTLLEEPAPSLMVLRAPLYQRSLSELGISLFALTNSSLNLV